jgi:signal transduction histidine kinase/ligand-binding sensor domain-containing protein
VTARRRRSLAGSLLLTASIFVPNAIVAAPTSDIRLVRVPIVTGAPLQFVRLPWKSSRFEVRRITQDNKGFLWLGASDALRRYDGVRFVQLPDESRSQRSSGFVIAESLMKDRAGMIWFGVEDFVERYDPDTGNITQFRTSADHPCGPLGPAMQISQDHDGKMWMVTETGLRRLDPVTLQVTCYGHRPHDSSANASPKLISTLQSRGGGLWVASDAGLDLVDPRSGEVIRHVALETASGARLRPSPFPATLFEDRSGVVWVGLSSGADLASVDPATGAATVYAFYRPGLESASSGVLSILEDDDRALWLGTDGLGLVRLEPDRQQAAWYESNAEDRNQLGGDLVVGLFRDDEGSFWAHTKRGDVYRFEPQPPFRSYRHQPGNASSLIDDFVIAAYEDSRGTLWVGTERGLNRVDRQSGLVTRYDRPPFNRGVRSIAEDRAGWLWFGSRGSGLERVDPRTGATRTYRHIETAGSLSHDYVASLLVDSTGTLWAATDSGIDRFDPARNTFRSYHPASQPVTRYHSIAEEPGGALWLASSEFGLDRFDPATEAFTLYRSKADDDRSLAHNRVYSAYVDHSGAVWAATYRGLDRFNPADRSFVHYTMRDGLPANTTLGVLEGDRGDLWVTTTNGLARFNPRTRTSINYDVADGLPTDLFSVLVAAVKSRSGEMFFGSYNGLIAVAPGRLRINHVPPPVAIEQITADRKTYDATQGLRLPPRVRDLTVDYTALSFVAAEKVRFRYKLEGFDDDWQEPGSRRQAFYTNLSPRGYRFRVIACNNSGVWNNAGAALDFSIAPAYYQTRWFETAMFVCVAFVLWIAHQVRMRRLTRQFSRTLDARVSERTRIARDLHDTLLQSFQGVLLRFQSVSKVLPAGADEARARLERALDQAEAAVTEGRNAVQGLRAAATTVNDLANGIVAIGAELTSDLSAVDGPTIGVDVDGASRDLNPVVRDEAYRIACEALRNAVKHAQARRVVVIIHYESRQFRLTVQDDGKGMNEQTTQRQQPAGHFGLPGMRERAAIVKGHVEVRSAPGAGTEIELRVPAAIAYRPSGRTSWWSRVRRRRSEPSDATVHS